LDGRIGLGSENGLGSVLHRTQPVLFQADALVIALVDVSTPAIMQLPEARWHRL
jgi:hypothetical protein